MSNLPVGPGTPWGWYAPEPETPIPAQASGTPSCPDCKGTGEVVLFTSTEKCKCRAFKEVLPESGQPSFTWTYINGLDPTMGYLIYRGQKLVVDPQGFITVDNIFS